MQPCYGIALPCFSDINRCFGKRVNALNTDNIDVKETDLYIGRVHDLAHFLFKVSKAVVIESQAPVLFKIAGERGNQNVTFGFKD